MVGTKGGGTLRISRSSQETFRKKACFFTSSASRSEAPSRRSGFFRSSCMGKGEVGSCIIFPHPHPCPHPLLTLRMMAMASRLRNLG